MTTPPRISCGTLGLAYGALRRRRDVIAASLADARRLAEGTGATPEEALVYERTRDDLAAVEAALTEISEEIGRIALAGVTAAPEPPTAPPARLTAGVAEETLGIGATEAPRTSDPGPLLRLGPGGDFTRDIRPEDLR